MPISQPLPPHTPPPTPDSQHGVRRLQSTLMEISALGKDYLHPSSPPVWAELFRLMGSWHLNEVEDIARYFNQRFPRHGIAILEARTEIEKWTEALRARLPYTLGSENDLTKAHIERMNHATSRLADIVQQFGIGQAVH